MSTRIRRHDFADFSLDLRLALEARVARLGYLGEFFRCGAAQPEALLDFVSFTEHAKGGLSDRMVELVALTVSTKLDNAYERHQHERLSVKLGFGGQWVADVEKLDPALLDDAGEAAVQRFLLAALVQMGHGAQPEFEAVVDAIGPEASVALLFVFGRYLVHAMFVNTLALQPPVSSIFDAN